MEYPYMGVELTGEVFSKLLCELFDGQQFRRKDAISYIREYHVSHGGLLNHQSYASAFKKAVERLEGCGLERVTYGVYRLRCNVNNLDDVDVELNENETVGFDDENSCQLVVEKEIGEGSSFVYVYYYACYRELSDMKGFVRWACKVGRSDVDVSSRIVEQVGTCFPEMPRIGLVIRCDDSQRMERVLHDVLYLNNLHIDTAPGKEWFMTTPDEVEQFYLGFMRAGDVAQ